MTDLFLHIFNIGITAGWLAIAVLLLRLVMVRKVSRAAVFALWSLVGVRLLFPISLESVLSLIPSAEPVPPTITTAHVPSVNVGIPVVDAVINPVISQTMTPKPEVSINPMQTVVAVGAAVWIVGIAVMLAYLLISYWYTCRRVRESLPLEKGIRCCDGLSSAFVIGLIRPRIYLPMELPAEDRPYVIAHERAHLQRGDHYWKLLGFLLLTVYWFHPLLWVSYVLMCKDIEFACDEKVIKTLGKDAKKPYAMALANCGLKRKISYNINRCPLAFGESKTKERVKHVLNYKKPTLWASILAGVLIVVTVVCFMTNPVSDAKTDDPTTPPNGQETTGIQGTEEITTETEELVTMPNRVPDSNNSLTSKEATEIKQAYVKKFGIEEKCPLEWLSIRYYGEFNGAHVMFVDGYYEFTMAECSELVGDILFPYSDGQTLLVYHRNEIYSLPDAYVHDILTIDDLHELLNIHLEFYPWLK